MRPVDVHPFFAELPEGGVMADILGVWSGLADTAMGYSWREIRAAIRSGALSDSE